MNVVSIIKRKKHHNNIYSNQLVLLFLTRLLKQTTGHREQPSVQQQQRHPQKSHFTLTGNVFFKTLLIRKMVSLNSSGATLETRPLGNSVLNLLLSPNLQKLV